MCDINYDSRTGILKVIGDSYDIDQAIVEAGLNATRRLYRSRCVPQSGLRVTEENGTPVNVIIKEIQRVSQTPYYEVTISPTKNPFRRAASQKRVQSIATLLEEHDQSPKLRLTQ